MEKIRIAAMLRWLEGRGFRGKKDPAGYGVEAFDFGSLFDSDPDSDPDPDPDKAKTSQRMQRLLIFPPLILVPTPERGNEGNVLPDTGGGGE